MFTAIRCGAVNFFHCGTNVIGTITKRKWFQQLGDIHCDPSRLVLAEQLIEDAGGTGG
jgi:hypothetical protein